MESVAPPPVDAELNLLTDWGDRDRESRTRLAAIASVLVHVFVIVAVLSVPQSWLESSPPPAPKVAVRHITPLIEPVTEMTQKAPNKGKVSKEFNAAEQQPRRRIQIPRSTISTTRPQALRPAPIPTPPVPQSAPVAMPEPPKVEAAKELP